VVTSLREANPFHPTEISALADRLNMDFIAALLEVLIPSRAAKAEMESLRLGLVRLAAGVPVVTGRPAERTDIIGALGGPSRARI
jgi:hypothetical protein